MYWLVHWPFSSVMCEHVILSLNWAKAGSMCHQNRQHGMIITSACLPKAKLEFANIRNYK
jgi:hypothetical protein